MITFIWDCVLRILLLETDLVEKIKMLTLLNRTARNYCELIVRYRRAAEAWDAGHFTAEVVPVVVKSKKGDTEVSVDEEYKGLKLEKVPTLKPVFKCSPQISLLTIRKDGTVTAANASAINDGASALVLTTLEKSKSLSAKPMARILSWADAATKPIDFTVAPSLAIPIALKRAGLEIKDIAKWEINEVLSPTISI
jgi:acetyl-CoA C-acetyltransferase